MSWRSWKVPIDVLGSGGAGFIPVSILHTYPEVQQDHTVLYIQPLATAPMAEADETAAQRQARIRRQKREAKIKAEGTDRLDRITRLSGRTPESARSEPSPLTQSPSPQPTSISYDDPPISVPTPADPALSQAQEQYLRTLLGQPEQGEAPHGEQEDPMMKMLNSILNTAGGQDADAGAGSGAGGLPFSPDDISKATGLPPFLTNMFMKQEAPPTASQQKTAFVWSVVHAVFALLVSIYLVYMVNTSTSLFGANPPPPATIRNPFFVFVTGELLIEGTKTVTAGQARKKGFGAWLQLGRDISKDGMVMIFMLGMAGWWKGWEW